MKCPLESSRVLGEEDHIVCKQQEPEAAAGRAREAWASRTDSRSKVIDKDVEQERAEEGALADPRQVRPTNVPTPGGSRMQSRGGPRGKQQAPGTANDAAAVELGEQCFAPHCIVCLDHI